MTAPRLLVDTCVLVGSIAVNRADHLLCREALDRCTQLVLCSQILREFLVVTTRPANVNGLGLSMADARALVGEFQATVPLLDERRPVWPIFDRLLGTHPVAGKHLHDVWLVATAMAHQMDGILTANARDFIPFAPHLRVLTPAQLLAP